MSRLPKPKRKLKPKAAKGKRNPAKKALSDVEESESELMRARLFDFYLESDAPEVDALVTQIAQSLWKQGAIGEKSYLDDQIAILRAILLNLFVASATSSKKYVGISRRPYDFRKVTRYIAAFARYPIFVRLVDGLLDLDLIEQKPGFRDRKTGIGFRSRIRAQKPLRESFKKHRLKRSMIRRALEAEVIILRNKKKENIDYSDTAETIAMRERLLRINSALSKAFIGLKMTDQMLRRVLRSRFSRNPDENLAERGELDLVSNQLVRIFNDGVFTRGGRFYRGWWQAVPSEYRKYICIAQEGAEVPSPTVEIDFSGMQPRTAYAVANAPAPADMYAWPGRKLGRKHQLRTVVKAALLRMLNAQSKPRAIKSLTKFYKEERISQKLPAPKQVIDQLEISHALIADSFYKKRAGDLVFIESKIAERVMLDMLDRGAIVLPIHDSFIVEIRFKDELVASMERAFLEVTGATCRLSVDETAAETDAKAMTAETAAALKSKPKVDGEIRKIAAQIRELMQSGHPVTLEPLPTLVSRLKSLDRRAKELAKSLEPDEPKRILNHVAKRAHGTTAFWACFLDWAQTGAS